METSSARPSKNLSLVAGKLGLHHPNHAPRVRVKAVKFPVTPIQEEVVRQGKAPTTPPIMPPTT